MCYVIVLTAGAVLCVMYQLAGGAFVSLFLDSGSSEAYSVGLSYVKFLSFFYSFIGLKASTDGLLRGAGDVTAFTVANLVNLAIRVSVTNLFAPIYGSMDGGSPWLGRELCDLVWMVSDRKMEEGPRDKEVRYR